MPEPTERLEPPAARPATVALERKTWLDAARAAGLAFLATLFVGGILIVAIKLQYPGFGSGGDPIEVFTSVVIASLGILRVPVHVGELRIVLLPLGAFVTVAIAFAWAVRSAGLGRAADGAKAGPFYAVLCWVAALIFRHRFETDPVFAGALGALFWGLVWGTAFGALGAAGGTRSIVRRARERLRDARPGIAQGLLMLGIAAAAGAAVMLLWIIAGLARGALPRSFDGGDALAGVVYLVALAPNLIAAVIALGTGAPIQVGARATVRGGVLGELESFSLFGWGGAAPPGWVFLLVLIPLVACVLGGMELRRRYEPAQRNEVVVTAAVVFAICLGTIVWLGAARLGTGVAYRGFALVAPHPLWTLLTAGVWGLGGGLAGWHLQERRRGA